MDQMQHPTEIDEHTGHPRVGEIPAVEVTARFENGCRDTCMENASSAQLQASFPSQSAPQPLLSQLQTHPSPNQPVFQFGAQPIPPQLQFGRKLGPSHPAQNNTNPPTSQSQSSVDPGPSSSIMYGSEPGACERQEGPDLYGNSDLTRHELQRRQHNNQELQITEINIGEGMMRCPIEVRKMVWDFFFADRELTADTRHKCGSTPELVKAFPPSHLFYHELIRAWYDASFVRFHNPRVAKCITMGTMKELKNLVISLTRVKGGKLFPDPATNGRNILQASNVRDLIVDFSTVQRHVGQMVYAPCSYFSYFKKLKSFTIRFQERRYSDQAKTHDFNIDELEMHLGVAPTKRENDGDVARFEIHERGKFLWWNTVPKNRDGVLTNRLISNATMDHNCQRFNDRHLRTMYGHSYMLGLAAQVKNHNRLYHPFP